MRYGTSVPSMSVSTNLYDEIGMSLVYGTCLELFLSYNKSNATTYRIYGRPAGRIGFERGVNPCRQSGYLFLWPGSGRDMGAE